jgi:hypothetical protein
MKVNAKILVAFLTVILLVLVQMFITYKLQNDLYENTLLIKEVEAPLHTLSEQVIGYDGILTGLVYDSLLDAQKGEYEEVKKHKEDYDEVGAKLDNLLKNDARILLGQSRRPKEVKDEVEIYLKILDEYNLKLVDLELKSFDSIEKKDLKTALLWVTGEEYHHYKDELYKNYRAWADLEHEMTVNTQNMILKDSQQIVFLNFGIAIGIMIMVIITMFTIRSFVSERNKVYKLLYDTSNDALMTIDPPNWKFTSANPATIRLFNVKDEKQFLSLTPSDLSPEKQSDGKLSRSKAKKMIQKAMKDGINSFKWIHKTYKGKIFNANVLLSKVKEKDRTFLQATVRKID